MESGASVGDDEALHAWEYIRYLSIFHIKCFDMYIIDICNIVWSKIKMEDLTDTPAPLPVSHHHTWHTQPPHTEENQFEGAMVNTIEQLTL